MIAPDLPRRTFIRVAPRNAARCAAPRAAKHADRRDAVFHWSLRLYLIAGTALVLWAHFE